MKSKNKLSNLGSIFISVLLLALLVNFASYIFWNFEVAVLVALSLMTAFVVSAACGIENVIMMQFNQEREDYNEHDEEL